MSAFAKSFLLLALALYVSALATPHFPRNSFEHHALAARAPVPVPVVEAVPEKRAVPSTRRLRKRANGRCKASSSAAPSSTVASSSVVASSSTAAPSVVNVAPSPSLATSSAAAPTTSSTPKPTSSLAAPKTTATPTTSSKAAATPTASSSSGDSASYLIGTQTGEGTFYGTGLGACGITNTDTDYIAAVSELLFDTYPGYTGGNPNNNPVCNKKVTATYQGKSVTVTITDRCTACAITDLDFSPSAFSQLADQSLGRLYGMTWVWDD